MLFGSLKDLLLCIACHSVRAVKSYLTAFQFIHVKDINTLSQRLSYKSNEIILYERFRDLDCQLLEQHISQISLFHLAAIRLAIMYGNG
jgi:hypothetical protein